MWCGDVWKTIVRLRSERRDLNIFVFDYDYGVGVITRGEPEGMLSFTEEEIDKMTYEDLEKNRKNFLNLKEASFFENFLENP